MLVAWRWLALISLSAACGGSTPPAQVPPPQFRGDLIAGVESPVLQATADARTRPCPVIQPPP